ncbi:MAG: OmpH family outer membrane protein, partial [Candidatus Methylomirabilales bacterium]
SEAARKERQDAITRKIRDLRRLFEDFNRDLQKRETELLNEILREIRKLVVAYGKDQQYTLILEAQSGIIYASQGADLTDEVLAAYNQRT